VECAVRFPKNLNSFLREYYSSVYIIIEPSRGKALKSPSDKKTDDHLNFFNASGGKQSSPNSICFSLGDEQFLV